MPAMVPLTTLFFAALASTVAQAPPAQAPPAQPPPPQAVPAAGSMPPLQNGACLDSARAVPRVLAPPLTRGMQIVRIDQVVSTSTMMPGEIVGFLYTTQNGSTWLGERSAQYMSPADATAINLVLASTHAPEQNVSTFPPQTRYGVATHSPQLFHVVIPPDALNVLHVQITPCVAWPADRPLPDPAL